MSIKKPLYTILTGILIFTVSSLPGKEIDYAVVNEYIRSMEQAYALLDGYTCTFRKQERIHGELLPEETIFLKFQKPFRIYMKWTADPYQGQELVYKADWDDGKVVAHRGSFPDITLRLSPENKLIMRNNRHPVTDAGIGHTIEIIKNDYQRAGINPRDSVRYIDHGQREIDGEQSRCLEAIMPAKENSGYYAHRALICINLTTHLPNHIKIWDHTNTLVEKYHYLNVNTQPELTSEDFNPENPAYGF